MIINILKINFLLFVLLIYTSNLTNAQNFVLDSLKKELQKAKHDTTRCKILYELVETESDDNVWPIYNDQLLKLSDKGTKTAPFYLKYLASALNNVGYSAKQHGDIPKALNSFLKSLKIREKINDKNGIASSLNNIGVIYNQQGNIPKALEYYHKSLKIQEEILDKEGIAISLSNIGSIYKNQGDYPKALEYYLKCLRIQEEIKYKQGVAISLNNIGMVYGVLGDIPMEFLYYQKSLKIREEIMDKEGIASSLNNIGAVFNYQGDFNKALEYFLKSLRIREEIKDKQGITESLNFIGNILLGQGKVLQALNYAKKSLSIANELGYPNNIKWSAGVLKNIYLKQKKFKEALFMYELEIQMRDSLNNSETKKAAVKKQFQYEYEKKAAADSVKHAEEQKVKNAQLTAQQAQLKQEKTQRFALYGGLFLVIAFSGFVFNRFKITQKQKKIIEEQKQEVDSAYEKLHEKNKEVLDSIHYAARIQRSLITSEKYIASQIKRLKRV